MKKYIRILIAAIVIIAAFPCVSNAQGSPFSWRANVKMLNATEGEIIVKVSIAEGWHLYGTSLPKGGPKPTVFDFGKSTGVKLMGKMSQSVAPVVRQDAMFGLKLSYWTGQVTFRQKFKVIKSAGARIEGVVSYMGCNDETCSAPATFKISKLIPVKK